MCQEGQDSLSALALWHHVQWRDSGHLHSSQAWKPGAELFKERSSSCWCQHHSPTLSLMAWNTKPQAGQVAVRAYSGRIRDIKGIFKAPFVFYVIFIPLMSMTTYSQVPKFLNSSKLQSSTKSFMPTIPKLTIYTQLDLWPQWCIPCPHQIPVFLHCLFLPWIFPL